MLTEWTHCTDGSRYFFLAPRIVTALSGLSGPCSNNDSSLISNFNWHPKLMQILEGNPDIKQFLSVSADPETLLIPVFLSIKKPFFRDLLQKVSNFFYEIIFR